MDPDTSWMKSGNCRDQPPEAFFPDNGTGVTSALRICSACAVRERCLAYAIAHHIDHGVWGGTSERARRRITRSVTRPVRA
jgi:WhiB family redox-sensing transcriptional regulator